MTSLSVAFTLKSSYHKKLNPQAPKLNGNINGNDIVTPLISILYEVNLPQNLQYRNI